MPHISAPLLPAQRRLIVYLAFLNAFVPLSTDLYLPAMPLMAKNFGAAPDEMNLTLLIFFGIFAIAMLIWGPLSDRCGRRPILLIGAAVYTASSAMCALAGSIGTLVFWRGMQAAGSGAICAVSMAIVKDSFKGRVMENVLAAIQTMTVLAPMTAPVIGSLLLMATTWSGVFWALSCCGALAFFGALRFSESLVSPGRGPIFAALGRLFAVLRVPALWRLLLLFSVSNMAFTPYIATASFIYQDIFGLSPQMFAVFFAANAACSLLGPLLYIRFLRELPKRLFVASCFIATACAGVLLLTVAQKSPLFFALSFFPVSLCGGAIRPYASTLMMTQLDSDNGSVAALIGSSALLFGCAAMQLCGQSWWPDFIAADGATAAAAGLFCLAFWLMLCAKKSFRELEVR